MAKKTPVKEDRVYGEKSGCGYLTNGDGVYQVSDTVRRSMDEAIMQERGVRRLLDSVNDFAAKRYSEIHKEYDRWWTGIKEDLKLDKDVNASYHDGVVTVKPKEPEKPPPRPRGDE